MIGSAANYPLLWNTFLGGSAHFHDEEITVDASGNTYVIGTSDSSWGSPLRPFGGGGSDAFLAKFDASGVLQWHAFLGGGDYDEGGDVVLDSSGNIYALGTSVSSWGTPLSPYSGGNCDVFVAKFDASGNLLWHSFYNFIYPYCTSGEAVAVDGLGNIYFTSLYGFVAKLDKNGALQWKTNTGENEGKSIAVDKNGNIYVAATSFNVSTDVWSTNSLWKFNANGAGRLIWDPDDESVNLESVAVDNNGNIYVAGSWGGAGPVFITKLDPDGDELWRTILGEDRLFEKGAVMANDSRGIYMSGKYAGLVVRSGNIYVIGTSFSTWGNPLNPMAGGVDVFIALLNGNGALRWNTFLGGSGNDSGKSFALDNSGNIYITGYSDSTWGSPLNPHGGGQDTFVAKWNNFKLTSPNGGEDWPFKSLQYITWKAPGLAGNVALSLYRNGVRIGPIATCPASRGYYAWKAGTYGENLLPVPAGGGYAVRITGSGSGDMSDDTFSIYKPVPSLEVTLPKGGESWLFKSQQNITWKALGLAGRVALSLYRDGRKIGWIASCPATRGSYSWKVGTYGDNQIAVPAGSGYSIVITRPGLAAASPGTFTIFR